MPSPGDEVVQHVLVVATGGTIAGTAAGAADALNYRSAQLGAQALIDAVPPLAGVPLRTLQLAQLDSKDMGHALWVLLGRTLADALARDEVSGIVVTHGTDTLEETAYFMQRVLAPHKPVVFTAAMRPASSLQADGPQNLLDAVTVAREPGARGVLVVAAGQVFAGDALRKVDAFRLDAFDGGDAGPIAHIEAGVLRLHRPWPDGKALGLSLLVRSLDQWPRVGWITSHAGFDGVLVDAAVAAGFDGLVIAGTGNGSLHAELEAAARRALAAGLTLRLSTRCASGRVVGPGSGLLAVSDAISPAQARVALLLELLREPRTARRASTPTPAAPAPG